MIILALLLVLASGAEAATGVITSRASHCNEQNGDCVYKDGSDVIELEWFCTCPSIADDCSLAKWTWALKTVLEMVEPPVAFGEGGAVRGEITMTDLDFDPCYHDKESVGCLDKSINNLKDKRKARLAADATQKEREQNIKSARRVLDQCGMKE